MILRMVEETIKGELSSAKFQAFVRIKENRPLKFKSYKFGPNIDP